MTDVSSEPKPEVRSAPSSGNSLDAGQHASPRPHPRYPGPASEAPLLKSRLHTFRVSGLSRHLRLGQCVSLQSGSGSQIGEVVRVDEAARR